MQRSRFLVQQCAPSPLPPGQAQGRGRWVPRSTLQSSCAAFGPGPGPLAERAGTDKKISPTLQQRRHTGTMGRAGFCKRTSQSELICSEALTKLFAVSLSISLSEPTLSASSTVSLKCSICSSHVLELESSSCCPGKLLSLGGLLRNRCEVENHFLTRSFCSAHQATKKAHQASSAHQAEKVKT